MGPIASQAERRPLLSLALALAALGPIRPAVARADDSLHCDGGIVSVGDHKIDLLGKCGEPALEEPRLEERLLQRGDERRRFGRRVSVTVERWTYDFGPQRFLQFVTLEAGRIVAVERGGYGYGAARSSRDGPAIPRATCDHATLRLGARTFDVLTTCGEPVFRELRLETVVEGFRERGQVVRASKTVPVEIWTYDFGPNAFVRFLEFVDGRLSRIESGSYGYSR